MTNHLAERRRRGLTQEQKPTAKPAQQRSPAPQRKPEAEDKQRRRKIPTVDLHIRVALEDVLIRISAVDWQRLVLHWKVGGEDVILRGPYGGMETDIILRGTEGGMVSVRPHQDGTTVPGFKLVLVSDMRLEFLDRAGI